MLQRYEKMDLEIKPTIENRSIYSPDNGKNYYKDLKGFIYNVNDNVIMPQELTFLFENNKPYKHNIDILKHLDGYHYFIIINIFIVLKKISSKLLIDICDNDFDVIIQISNNQLKNKTPLNILFFK